MSGGDERLVAEIPAELKRLVDADSRTNREVVEAALWREFGGHKQGALEQRIEEQQRRVEMIRTEMNKREQELETELNELQALKSKLGDVTEEQEKREDTLKDAIEKAKGAPRDPDNPAIRTQARRVDMTPEEFIDELPDTGSEL